MCRGTAEPSLINDFVDINFFPGELSILSRRAERSCSPHSPGG